MAFSILMIILVFGMLFLLLYYAMIDNVPRGIITEAKLTPIDVLKVVDTDLKKRISGYTDFGVYSIYGFYFLSQTREDAERHGWPDGFVKASQDIQLGKTTISKGDVVRLELPLFYQHPNSTKFFVNGTSGQIIDSCISSIECPPSKPFSDYAEGKLVYFMDIIYRHSNNEGSQYRGAGYYLIDARNGEVLYTYFY